VNEWPPLETVGEDGVKYKSDRGPTGEDALYRLRVWTAEQLP
jgi:hypothetical protein